MISIEINDKPDQDWNKHLAQSVIGTVYQTAEYAQFLKLRHRADIKFLKFYNHNDELVGQLLISQTFLGRRKVTEISRFGTIYSAMAKFSKLLPKYSVWVYGPIIHKAEYTNELLEVLCNTLKSWNSRIQGTLHPFLKDVTLPATYNFSIIPKATFIIDLKLGLDKIFDNTDKHSVQKNIKRSKERGVTITQFSSEKDLLIYGELLNKHREEQNLSPYSLTNLLAIYNHTKSIGQTGFLAWYKENPVAGIMISSYNNYINEWGIARSTTDTQEKLYSLDLLRWQVIEWGIKNGCQYYDLTGIKPGQRSPKEEGLYRNKAKWGGKQYDFCTIEN